MKGILQDLTNRHIDRATAYGTEASTEKCKIMTNSRNNIIADISMNGQKLEEVMFQVPWSIPVQGWRLLSSSPHQDCLSNGSNGRLKGMWRCNTVSFASKFKLYKSLVSSIFLYGCKTWTLLADSERRIQAFETKCLRKLRRISCLEHETNDWVRGKINFLVGPQEPLLATVKRRKLAWFGHATRRNSLSKTILQGTLEGGRRRGRQRKCCMDNIKEWTSLPMPKLFTRASCRKDWKRIC